MIHGDAIIDDEDERDDQDDEDQDDLEDDGDDQDEQHGPFAGEDEPAPGKPGTRRLECKLTDEEIAVTAREMAKLEMEIENTENHKKEAMAEFAGELKEMRARSRKLARGVREGVIERSVEIRQEVHNLLMVTVRLDTGETINTRPLNEQERQQAFAGMTAPEKAEAMPAAAQPESVQTLQAGVLGALADYAEGRTAKDLANVTGAREEAVGEALEQLFVMGKVRRPATPRAKKWFPVPAAPADADGGAP